MVKPPQAQEGPGIGLEIRIIFFFPPIKTGGRDEQLRLFPLQICWLSCRRISAMELNLLKQFLLSLGRRHQGLSRWVWWPRSLPQQLSLTPLGHDLGARMLMNVLTANMG